MKIIVDRNSVCAGDDIYNHEMTFEVPESLTVARILLTWWRVMDS